MNYYINHGEISTLIWAKTHKITLERKIWFLVHKIKQYDKSFDALNNVDIEESEQRIQFFIRDEKYLKMLDDKNFKSLLNQIEKFYKEKEQSESLVDWNYRVNLYEDYTIEETIAKIAKEEINDSLNSSFTYKKNDKINFKNEHDNDINIFIQKKDETIYSNQNDVTLACEDKQNKTHKQIISSNSSQQVYNNISEELLREIYEEVTAEVFEEIEEWSQSIYENISKECFSEIYKELYTEIFGEISNKISEEVCNEVSTDLCEEVVLEILTEFSEMSQFIYENVFQELASEIYNKLINSATNFLIKKEDETNFSIKMENERNFPIQHDKINLSILEENEINFSSQHNKTNFSTLQEDDINLSTKINLSKEFCEENVFIEHETETNCQEFESEELVFVCDLCLYKTTKIQYLEWHVESFHETETFYNAKSDLKKLASLSLKSSLVFKSNKNVESNHEVTEELNENDQSNLYKKLPARQDLEIEFDDSTMFNTLEDDDNILQMVAYPESCGNVNGQISIYQEILQTIKLTEVIKTQSDSCEQYTYKVKHECKMKALIKPIHKENVFPCEQCTYKFRTKFDLKVHVKRTHECQYTCDKCDSAFSSKSDLKVHKKVTYRKGHLIMTIYVTNKNAIKKLKRRYLYGKRNWKKKKILKKYRVRNWKRKRKKTRNWRIKRK